MPEHKAAPTIEQFTEKVRAMFKAMWKTLDDSTIDAYLQSEEAVFEIKNRYEETMEEFKKGETTYDQFMVGVAGSVGYCLAMMY